MRPAIFIAILIASFGAQACSQAQPPQKPQTALEIRGNISPSLVESVRKSDLAAVDFVTISAEVGSSEAANELSLILDLYDKPLHIVGVCGNACLLASLAEHAPSPPAFEEHSVLLLDKSATSFFYMFRKRYPRISEGRFAKHMKSELAAVDRAGLDRRILLLPQIIMNTKCIFGPEVDDLRNYEDTRYASQYSGWIPPYETMRKMNYKFKGRWRRSANYASLSADIQRHDPTRVISEAIETEVEKMSFEKMATLLEKLPDCSSIFGSNG